MPGRQDLRISSLSVREEKNVRANNTHSASNFDWWIAKAVFASRPMGFYFPRPEHVFMEEFQKRQPIYK